MATLDAAAPGCARFVGGCVRDSLFGETPKDIDIATQLEPEAVIAALKAAGLGAAPTGLEHGTVTAVADHTGVEVTTLRADVSTDGRRATVAFTTDWAQDAARRD
ncbi:MAG: CCA tRNA nucleotidyltransferase, partial [Pseudomonadota bacterium]